MAWLNDVSTMGRLEASQIGPCMLCHVAAPPSLQTCVLPAAAECHCAIKCLLAAARRPPSACHTVAG